MRAHTALVLLHIAFAASAPLMASDLLNEEGVSFHCVGNCDSPVSRNVTGATKALVMCGGHMYPGVTDESDLEAYRFLLEHAKGGDILVLTADEDPCDIYNPFIYNMSGLPEGAQPNSVTTACFTERSGSSHPRVASLLQNASAVFVTGGDQGKYYHYWRDSPVSELLPHVPGFGGSSAGLAVQGQFVFNALEGSVVSSEALHRPMERDITLTDKLFSLEWMKGVLTDTHFFQRDRMGRIVTFLARVAKYGWAPENKILGVAISEHTAVLVDGETGEASVMGAGPAYFLMPTHDAPERCTEGEPLTYRDIRVLRWNNTGVQTSKTPVFSFANWEPTSAGKGVMTPYNLSAVDGRLESTQPDGSIY